MIRTREIAFLLLGIVIGIAIVAAHSEGTRLEVEGGRCKASPSAEGTWWQKGLEYHQQLKDRCGSGGFSFDTPISNVSFKVRGTSLGQFAVSSTSNADDNDDKSRRGSVSSDPRRPECAEQLDKTRLRADCHYNWNGSGSVEGGVIALAWEPLKIGPIRIGGEIGLFIYKARWREVIRPIDCPANQCWEMQVDQRTNWQRAPEFGLTARWEYLYVGVRRYELRMPGGTADPREPSQAPNITAGFRAPINQFVVGLSIPL